jgi:LysR family transcriptional regulator, transcriptional activator for dmlA
MPTTRSDLELVLAVQETGSLIKASEKLELSTPMMTKRLAALERTLGVKLFFRTTRKVTPTAEGELFCERAKPLVDNFLTLEDELREQVLEPSGLIKIVSTFGFGRLWLGPAIAAWSKQYPKVRVDLRLTEALPDLAAGGFDAAVWLWAPSRANSAKWSARLLANNERVLVASPGYIAAHGSPASIDDLSSHECLAVHESDDRGSNWLLTHSIDNNALHNIKIKGALSSNSGELVRDWCVQGKGIMLRSLWDVSKLLSAGTLVRVLPNYAMKDANIQWLAPFRTHTPLRVSLLRDYLMEAFKNEPWLRSSTDAQQVSPQTKRLPRTKASPRSSPN